MTRENAHTSGVGEILDRVLVELVTKMQEMAMDKTELGCLRSAHISKVVVSSCWTVSALPLPSPP